MARTPAPADWQDDLRPLPQTSWNYDTAAHLLERAGFGGTPPQIQALADMGLTQAVRQLVHVEGVDNSHLPPFEHSGLHDQGLEPFPPSRPAVTEMAKATGQALGIQVKAGGNRPLQPIVNKFFYWLRASVLETDRVAWWWANRMVASNAPLQEKMALFWHGHFAVNVRGAPNENFAREIMELFTMGVGHYSETDIREAARAFTGWNYVDLDFVVNADQHDDGEKHFLGRTGAFTGEDIIDIILEQPVTAEHIAGKLYRFFVREDLSPAVRTQLGNVLREADYELAPLLETLFLSRDFYSNASVGTQIKSPVQLAVSTYRRMGLQEAPGVPDFNRATGALGQALFRPPTVAGWAGGRSWMTPGLLLERGNFARDILFPDINFLPSDRYNNGEDIRGVAERIRQGLDITNATQPALGEGAIMAESNLLADRDEDFNTRYGSFRGWQMAIERVKPIPRHFARMNFSALVREAGLSSTEQVVDHFIARFLLVEPSAAARQQMIAFLDTELGTSDIARAESYMEDGLRMLLHVVMSQPEYQLA